MRNPEILNDAEFIDEFVPIVTLIKSYGHFLFYQTYSF